MAIHQATIDAADLDVALATLRRMRAAAEDGIRSTQVIVVINGKGGVGKSSLASAIAVALAKMGLSTVLCEMDAQGNNAEDLGYLNSALADDGLAQAAAILDGKPLVPTGAARPNLHVVPGGVGLEDVLEELYVQRRLASYAQTPEDQTAWMGMYAAAIEPLRAEHDVIILDVAPGSEPLQLQALVAGDMVLVPSRSDLSSRKGLRQVARLFPRARALNSLLELLGVVVFASNPTATKVQANIKDQLTKDLKGAAPVFDQTIRAVESAAVECRARGKVPQELATSRELTPAVRRSMQALAGDYKSLAMEVLQAKAELDAKTAQKATA
ncbi:ParA family protein [Streptomyces sp. BH097]|uniref:ParA family protein n=1 Tax=unclassified Streptomyces TaxID=2593676 RepID=UPI003BB75CFA